VLTVTVFDTVMVMILSVISVLALILLYHQLVYIAYDEEAAKIAGVRVRLLNYIFSILVASAISVTIRIVGVLVISSMIALPVAAALQLGKGFKVTLVFSVIFSVIDIMLGLILSYYLGVAPGGFTALVSVAVLVVVILAKGIIKKAKTPNEKGAAVS
jgi:zinc transport system permease protein